MSVLNAAERHRLPVDQGPVWKIDCSRQGCQTPVLEDQSPATFRCLVGWTHFNQMVELPYQQTVDLYKVLLKMYFFIQMCWSKNASKNAKTMVLQDWNLTVENHKKPLLWVNRTSSLFSEICLHHRKQTRLMYTTLLFNEFFFHPTDFHKHIFGGQNSLGSDDEQSIRGQQAGN